MGNSSEDTDFDNSGKFYKCCKNKTLSVSTCVRCGGVFHNSCVERLKIVKTVGGNKVICCKENETVKSNEVVFLEKQVQLLEELNNQKDIIIKDKEEIIKLLNEKIIEVENKLKSWDTIHKKSNGNPHDAQSHRLGACGAYAKTNSTANLSYANVTKSNKENVLVIKPLNKQDSKDTKKDIKDHVKIADIKVAISSIKEINNGGISWNAPIMMISKN